MIVKNRRRVDFYTHVVATTPEDSSSRRRIWRYGERSFPSMRTASFRGFFTFGRRSRGRRSDLLKLPTTAAGAAVTSVGKEAENTPVSSLTDSSSNCKPSVITNLLDVLNITLGPFKRGK